MGGEPWLRGHQRFNGFPGTKFIPCFDLRADPKSTSIEGYDLKYVCLKLVDVRVSLKGLLESILYRKNGPKLGDPFFDPVPCD